jgi:predicted enzyme related to lactoylglutathione lyase
VIQLFRVILPVSDIERAPQFYGALLDASGSRVSPGVTTSGAAASFSRALILARMAIPGMPHRILTMCISP